MTALAATKNLTVGKFAEAFARANKGLRADMLRVTTTRGNWLSEVWLCMDRAMAFTRCPAHQGGAAPASLLRIGPGPRIAYSRPAISVPWQAKPAVTPARKPGLILDLDPNVQPLSNASAP